MEDLQAMFKISEEKYITRSDMLSLLKTYNCYHEGKNFQLRCREEDGQLIMEGLLSISWGLRRPIRLQMQDDNERFHHPSATPFSGEKTQNSLQNQTCMESNNNSSEKISPHTSQDVNPSEEETPQLMRTRSDASFMRTQRRSRLNSPGDTLRIRRHRFSINGHFYNHKTSVFTPAYGSVTNVRVNSTMTTQQVLQLLLNKFRVENKLDEFALYMVHESGAKIFLMERDLGEEVTCDVAQYIKFEIPVLDSFVEKLKEEEEREISKLTRKYSTLKSMIMQRLKDISETSGHS
ncbi:ras association domain-containing protein 4a isoform X2 [Scleropages formosus]|uniref:ras association domain-containing protein 4a isoform X2 n=1 Tax=Scleropages formosus TaxID=113540 RepID=UPI0010FA66C3|nr:ras association domain-containing protein 4 isoform X2 [Scleropages formosus]